MKNVCKKDCTECVYSYNPILCLAPHFEMDAFTPITQNGLRKIRAVLFKRIMCGSSIYDSDYGKGQRSLDIRAFVRIEGELDDDLCY